MSSADDQMAIDQTRWTFLIVIIKRSLPCSLRQLIHVFFVLMTKIFHDRTLCAGYILEFILFWSYLLVIISGSRSNNAQACHLCSSCVSHRFPEGAVSVWYNDDSTSGAVVVQSVRFILPQSYPASAEACVGHLYT